MICAFIPMLLILFSCFLIKKTAAFQVLVGGFILKCTSAKRKLELDILIPRV